MKQFFRRLRATLFMGAGWALAWAPIGVLAGLIIDPDGSMDEMWFLVGAYPGFMAGVLFSVALWGARGYLRLETLSVRRMGVWGAVFGLAVGVSPFMLGSANASVPLWLLAGGFATTTTLLGAASAAGTLRLAQRAIAQQRLEPVTQTAELK